MGNLEDIMKIYKLIFCIVGFITSSFSDRNLTEQLFLNAGLVNIHNYDRSIKVDLVNSHKKKNFFNKNFYQGLQKAYLQKSVAQKLAKAQKILKTKHPQYSLLIMDAARPNSVSFKMYEQMKGTKFEKFVANPYKGSLHNYGVAVDLTIVDSKGNQLDMGFTPFYKSKVAIVFSYIFTGRKKLTKVQKENRLLLKNIMKQAGFIPLGFEWWHFDGFTKSYTKKHFKMIK